MSLLITAVTKSHELHEGIYFVIAVQGFTVGCLVVGGFRVYCRVLSGWGFGVVRGFGFRVCGSVLYGNPEIYST